MSRIDREKITMKPKWYFIAGSLAMVIGIIGSVIISVFLVSLTSFSLRTHGPMGEIRYQQLLSNFPWWAPVIAIAGLGIGIWLLNKYDFSYKRNFVYTIFAFIVVIILSGWLIDYLGIDKVWVRTGPMRRFYERYDGGFGNNSGKKMNQNKQIQGGNGYGKSRMFNND